MALWDDTPSDGVFRFYWADHEEFEYASGPFNSVEEAWAHAQKQAEEESWGPEPGATIYVARADKRTTVAPTFDVDALVAEWRVTGAIVFDTEEVLDLFMEANEDCWGEDGWDGLTGDAEAAEAALLRSLNDAVRAWSTHVSDNDRAEAGALQTRLRGAVQRWESEHRDQIKTWMFGRMDEPVEFKMPELTAAELHERNIRHLQRHTGLPREQVEAAMRGDHQSIIDWLQANRTPAE